MKIKGLCWLLLILGACSATGAARAQEITGNNRLMENFIQDGAVLRQGWLEARTSYSNWTGGHDYTLGAQVAFSARERFEFGGRFDYLDRERSRGDVLYGERLSSGVSDNGPGDADLYGKFRFRTQPRDWSAGILVKLPSANDHERLGSGRTDYEAFLATRQTFTRFAWIGNASMRVNGDSRAPGEAGGRVSAALGGGVILKLSYSWSFLAETRYETRRYQGGEARFVVAPAFDFRPTENLAFRLGASLGLADGSPNQAGTFAVVFHF